MAIHRNSHIILQLLMLLVECFGVEATGTFFYIQPYDVKQVLPFGSSTLYMYTLPCGVENLPTGKKVAWYKNGRQISTDYTVYSNFKGSGRYAVDVSKTSKRATFNLQITTSIHSAAMDSGNYYCRVQTTPSIVSRRARVDVFVTPQNGSIQCSIGDDPDDVLDVNEGIEISLSCRSDPTGVPEMITYWTKEGLQSKTFDSNTTISTISDGWRVLSFSWTPTNPQNGATFTCNGFHPGYNIDRKCQLGPFNVLYRPMVKLSPSTFIVTKETEVVTFTCIADANPQVTRYEWSNSAGKKFSLQGDNVIVDSDGKWLQMKNFGSQDNGVYYVTCYAENEVGELLANGTSTLTVNIQAWTTVKTVTEYLSTATSRLSSTVSSLKNKTVTEHVSTATGNTVGEHLSTATSKTVSEHFSTPTSKTVVEHLSTVTSTLTASSIKSNAHIPTIGQHDMTSVTQVGASTSYYYGINKTAKTGQTKTIVIIGNAVAGCSFIFGVIILVYITVCVCKSRKKTSRKELADTHSSSKSDEDLAIVNSVGVEETMQALEEPSVVVRVGKQETAISPITTHITNTVKTDTANEMTFTNKDRDQSTERPLSREITAATELKGQSSDDEFTQTETDISAMYASVDLSKKWKRRELLQHDK